jgi:predicted nucleic acid-binding protein
VLSDIVIDTNVFLHAQNPRERRFAASGRLLARLLRVPTELCVDPGFSLDEASNESLIGQEYLDKIRAGSIGYVTLVQVLLANRVKEVDRRLDARERACLRHWSLKPRDRTFLAVAINSNDQVLVTHDYEDFGKSKRRDIRKRTGAKAVEASDAFLLLRVAAR